MNGEPEASRSFELVVFAPVGGWLTANRPSSPWVIRRLRAEWRRAAFDAAAAAHLPVGLARVQIHAVARFWGRAPVRDRDNLRPTLKAVIDGLGPPQLSSRTSAPGWGLIPNDDDAHLDGPYLTIGAKLSRDEWPSRLVLTIVELPVGSEDDRPEPSNGAATSAEDAGASPSTGDLPS